MSGIGCWVVGFAVIWLLGSVGLGWLVNSLFILLGVILLLPIVIFIGLRGWLHFNLVQGPCPVCQTELTSFKQTQLCCPHCGEPLQVEGHGFVRLTPPGTVDVSAVEVNPLRTNTILMSSGPTTATEGLKNQISRDGEGTIDVSAVEVDLP